MRIYIAGKITGLVYEDALRMFAEAALEIERCGHTAVNPMKEVATPDLPWVEYMERDIPLLLSCQGIYLLPNWKESNGARIEKVIAEHSKMLIVTAGFQGRKVFPANNANERDSERPCKYCGRCGRKLKDNEQFLLASECFRCHNGVVNKVKPEEWIVCQSDGCSEKFIQTDPDAEVDLCPPCEAALMRAAA